MSAITLESVDFSARNEAEISAWDFVKDVAGNRPYYILETPKFVLDVVIASLGVAGSAINSVSRVCSKVVNTENVVALFQDVMVIPTQCKKLATTSVEWIRGEEGAFSALNQVRKTIGLFASTLGDFVNSCDAIEAISTSISEAAVAPPFRRWSVFTEKAGAIGSAVGSASRIVDYALGDLDNDTSVALKSSQEQVRNNLFHSKNMWNLARDVSILAVSVLTVYCGAFAAIPAGISIGLSGSILGSRLVSYYREVQIKALEDSRPGLVIAKKELNA